MKKCLRLLPVLLTATLSVCCFNPRILAAPAAAGGGGNRFDGTWDVSIYCPDNVEHSQGRHSAGRTGFTLTFDATVKDGVLHGQYGTAHAAGSLTLDGKIAADGAAQFSAKGLTGESQYTVGGNVAPGTPYGYKVDARFEERKGKGERVGGRVCHVEFRKKR